MAIEQDAARLRIPEAHEQLGRGGFSCPGRTYQGDRMARWNGDVDMR